MAAVEDSWIEHNLPAELPRGEVVALWLGIEHRGSRVWEPGAVRIEIAYDGARLGVLDLSDRIELGGRAFLHWVFRTPLGIGGHEFSFARLADGAEAAGLESEPTPPLRVPVEIVERPRTESGVLRDRVLLNHARGWLVCDGVSWSRTGRPYPQFARSGLGCRTVDLEGREYVDYLMGWGSALLGYAHPRIQEAVAASLSSGAITTLTHHLMPEVAETLCAMFPGAQAATFGKNGSDVCTAAVRLARSATGRPVVLTCGYHGWQDWHVEKYGFAATGVPVRGEPIALPFRPGDRDQIAQLFEAHRGQVAAVMLEPAGVIEGTSGPIRDADPEFLRDLAALARQEGALIVFDEILTGFRHPGGSAQHAAGVVPDLTCLGKALSAGMPLAALIGRKEIFDAAIGKIFYEPTFKGEAYSFAAAREALAIYREEDVPARIAAFGARLGALTEEMSAASGVAAEMIGPPFRRMLVFHEKDPRKRTLLRTLFHQELLREGVLTTQNLFLPSRAHDDEAFDLTRRAFERAFAVLAEAVATDRIVSSLEIPPLPG